MAYKTWVLLWRASSRGSPCVFLVQPIYQIPLLGGAVLRAGLKQTPLNHRSNRRALIRSGPAEWLLLEAVCIKCTQPGPTRAQYNRWAEKYKLTPAHSATRAAQALQAVQN